jgi:hypothetical protein
LTPSPQLKHALTALFAVLFAIGADRLFKVLDTVLEPVLSTAKHQPPTQALHGEWYFRADLLIPIVMIMTTLYVGVLASIANDRYLENRPHESSKSWIALLSFLSLACVLFLFYVSADVALVW